MLQCFFDNSGGTDAPVFVMAGYLAREKQWEAFAEDWKRVLDLEEPRPLIRLKMAEAFQLKNRESEFYGWTEEQRDERLKKFVRVIHDHVEHSVACAIPVNVYQHYFAGRYTVSRPDGKTYLALDRPFYFAFWSVAVNATKINKQLNIEGRIDLIFDKEGGESKALMAAEYEKFARLAPDSVKPTLPALPRFEDDVEYRPLQAADMIAWLIRRYYADLVDNKEPQLEPHHKFLANLFLPPHDVIDVWTAERIADAAKALAGSGEE